MGRRTRRIFFCRGFTVLGYTVRHSLSCCTRRVVPNNTNPHDLKKKRKKKSPRSDFLSFPSFFPSQHQRLPTHERSYWYIYSTIQNSLSLRFSPELLSSILVP